MKDKPYQALYTRNEDGTLNPVANIPAEDFRKGLEEAKERQNPNVPGKARVTFTDDIVTVSILVSYKPEERDKIVVVAKLELSFMYDIDVIHVSNYRVVCVETEQPDGTFIRISVS
jgi:hypothetical protein